MEETCACLVGDAIVLGAEGSVVRRGPNVISGKWLYCGYCDVAIEIMAMGLFNAIVSGKLNSCSDDLHLYLFVEL